MPPQAVFDAEPARGWCYFYEKAALARQRGDWKTAASLGDQALSQKLAPFDLIEWMPFLQAYAALGNTHGLAGIGEQLAADPFVEAQACTILGKMSVLSAAVQEQMQTLFCPAQP